MLILGHLWIIIIEKIFCAIAKVFEFTGKNPESVILTVNIDYKFVHMLWLYYKL